MSHSGGKKKKNEKNVFTIIAKIAQIDSSAILQLVNIYNTYVVVSRGVVRET